MKLHAFLIVIFALFGFVAGFLVKPPVIDAGIQDLPSMARFLNLSDRQSLIGMDINAFLERYAGGGMRVSGSTHGDSVIEVFVNNDEKKTKGRYLAVHFDGTTVRRAEITTKAPETESPEKGTIYLGDIILR